MADDFCKEFAWQEEKYMIEDKTSFFQQFHCQFIVSYRGILFFEKKPAIDVKFVNDG